MPQACVEKLPLGIVVLPLSKKRAFHWGGTSTGPFGRSPEGGCYEGTGKGGRSFTKGKIYELNESGRNVDGEPEFCFFCQGREVKFCEQQGHFRGKVQR